MANEEQLELLKQGANAWNAWRKKNPDTRANLSGAHLSGMNLSGANLRGTNLNRADLSEATLSRADLSGATLNRAFLSGATLSGADLSRADLRGAKNLTREQIESAIINEHTQLPDYFKAEVDPEEK